MSGSVLSQRLNELRDAGLATPDEFGAWELTSSGMTIATALTTLVDELESAAEGPEPRRR